MSQSTSATNADFTAEGQAARLSCEATARGQQREAAAFMGGPQPSGGELAATGDCPGQSKE